MSGQGLTARVPGRDMGWHFVARWQSPVGWLAKWEHLPTRLIAVSGLERTVNGLEWHVSVTTAGERCSDDALCVARFAFGMAEAEEDNHAAGKARHLWMPVDPAKRTGCHCKEDGITHVEPDGYTWSEETAEAPRKPEGEP